MAKSQSESRLRGAFPPICHCEKPKATKQSQEFAEGKQTMPGPGRRTIAFRHCQERKILSLRGVQRRGNPITEGSLNEAGLKLGFTEEIMIPIT
jgi:hypothetical protein